METLKILNQCIGRIKNYLSDTGVEQYKELLTAFNSHVRELHEKMNPKDAWMENSEEFRNAFDIWSRAISPEKALNEGRRLAVLAEIRELSPNVEIATKLLLNAAKSGTMKFSEAIKHLNIPAAAAAEHKKEKTETQIIDFQEIEKKYNIKILEKSNDKIVVKGQLSPFKYAQLEKETKRKIIINS